MTDDDDRRRAESSSASPKIATCLHQESADDPDTMYLRRQGHAQAHRKPSRLMCPSTPMTSSKTLPHSTKCTASTKYPYCHRSPPRRCAPASWMFVTLFAPFVRHSIPLATSRIFTLTFIYLLRYVPSEKAVTAPQQRSQAGRSCSTQL